MITSLFDVGLSSLGIDKLTEIHPNYFWCRAAKEVRASSVD
jgi:hypothetical protein